MGGWCCRTPPCHLDVDARLRCVENFCNLLFVEIAVSVARDVEEPVNDAGRLCAAHVDVVPHGGGKRLAGVLVIGRLAKLLPQSISGVG